MSDQKTETAFVLPADAFPGSDAPVHFGGFPGIWEPGRPIAVSELGFATVGDARDARKEFAPELDEKSVKVGSAPMPERENHVPAEPAAAVDEGEPEPASAAEEGPAE